MVKNQKMSVSPNLVKFQNTKHQNIFENKQKSNRTDDTVNIALLLPFYTSKNDISLRSKLKTKVD